MRTFQMPGLRKRFRAAAVWTAAAAFLCVPAPLIAAESEGSADRSVDPRVKPSLHTQKIPGSRSTIRPSSPGSYLQPKKHQTYQQHMDSLKTHRFKNETDTFGYGRAASPSDSIAAHSSSRVLTSAKPPASRIQTQSNPGRRGSELHRNQPLTSSEHHFLSKLSSTVAKGDPATAARIDAIRAGQKNGDLLSQSDYDFLSGIAARAGAGEAGYRLRNIAEKRRERS